MQPLSTVAPAFVEMAHRIVWCVAATTGTDGRPRTRVLHPMWEWDGETLTGWIATSPRSPKAADLAATPAVSLTYWAGNHDSCTADCDARFEPTTEDEIAGWERFANGPAPVGYDPSIIPAGTGRSRRTSECCALAPHRLRVMPGTVMTGSGGELLAWRSTP